MLPVAVDGTPTSVNGARVFRARSSVTGWISSLCFLGVVTVPATWFLLGSSRAHSINWVVVAPLALLAITALFFLAVYPSIRYEILHHTLLLRCGPFRWPIAIQSIRSITEKNLSYLPLSEGWKLPGYALFSMTFGDVGRVRMCATSLTRRILLIETDGDVWGITPADVQGLLNAIKAEQGAS